MAVAVVRKAQTAGTAAALIATEGATATAGNLLVVGASEVGTTEVKFSDNKGETGWHTVATHAEQNASASTTWIGWKIAVGGETEIKATGGTIEGLSYIEASGITSPEVDSVQAHSNVATAKTHTTTALTTTGAEQLIFAAVGFSALATETVSAWTGTGVLNNVSTSTTRCLGGWFVTAAKWTANTATANWKKELPSGSVIISFKSGSAEPKTFTEAVTMRAGAQVATAEVAVFPTAQTIRAGARTQPIAAAVFPAAIKLVAGARTSPSAALNVSVAPSIRVGARMAVQAALVAPAAVRMRAGAGIVTAGRATFVVSNVMRAGAQLVPVVAGEGITYKVAVSMRAGARINPTVASPTPVGRRAIIFVFDE